MKLVNENIVKARKEIEAQIDAEAARDGAAIRKSHGFRLHKPTRRQDSRCRTRPRVAV